MYYIQKEEEKATTTNLLNKNGVWVVPRLLSVTERNPINIVHSLNYSICLMGLCRKQENTIFFEVLYTSICSVNMCIHYTHTCRFTNQNFYIHIHFNII